MTEAEYVNFIKEETDLDREADLYSLEHYGIPGMKWGVRRTPAQLGHKENSARKKKTGGVISKLKKSIKKKQAKAAKAKVQKKEESAEELKKKVLSSNDPKFIYQHMDLLDSRELQDRIDRISKETRMKELANPKKKDTIKTAEDFLKSTASMAESVTKIYNAYNVVTGKTSGKSNQGKSQQIKPQENKPSQNKPQENKTEENRSEESKNEGKGKGILDKIFGRRDNMENVSKAVDDIMNDPAVQALMNAPVLTQKNRDDILKRAQEEKEKRKKNHFGLSNSSG